MFSTDVDWRRMSWEKLISDGCIEYYSELPYEGPYFIKKLLKLFYSWNINKRDIRVPFRSISYKGILKAMRINPGDSVKIIFYDRSRASYDFRFISYLRKNIPGVKIGYLFSDVVDKSGAKIFKIVDQIKLYYDKVYSFDKRDAQKYGFDYSYLIYDKIVEEEDLKNESDVFLVAQAKDRLADLLAVYDLCVDEGLITDFCINRIPEDQLPLVGNRNIQINTVLPYENVVDRLRKSKCIVDIMQKGSVGITLNIVEAVTFGIKAISNNRELVNEPFYDPSRILILQDGMNLQEFLYSSMNPYSENDRALFSGMNLFQRL